VGRRSGLSSFVRAVPVARLLALAAPAAAQASTTLSVTGTAPHKVLNFTVDDALGHSTSASTDTGDLVITDDVALAVGASGCIALDANTANCGAPSDFERVVLAFGDGNDGFGGSDSFPIDITVDGGSGDDILNGGAGDDELVGGPGDDVLDGRSGDDELLGGDGDDYLSGDVGIDRLGGGDGDDYLRAAETPPVADAVISCGPGADSLDEDDGVDMLASDCETTEPPQLQDSLAITGDPRVGNVLALSIPTNVGGDGVVTIDWFRCAVAVFGCDIIDGAHGASYTPTESDRGSRLLARYWVENGLGADAVWSPETEIVRSALPPHHTPVTHQPVTHQPVTPRPPVAVRTRVLGPFLLARAPSFAVRNGKPVVDTGRRIRCAGAPSRSCQLSVTARPSGASARLRGRPAIAGTTNVAVAGGAEKKVMLSLNRSAYRLLRAHRKLTLSVTAVLTRPGYTSSQTTFTITVKAPARGRR
jgi:RTX calcium-binding nonapeptide repeat (4 copies)